ncbi:hypothetical protein ACKUB1_04135 [Methanospirillum stamsii]|uniref:Uncharacterized protein n=1 Tax=Methanospirillum stamsii TaxID=1277351 RepID=A0A2V2N7E8_9EURY|nr:hypothetical protein [Methanospirillum stamsii]PWR73636.1 hypothetical protein DLD82_10440 [Methanospirillum stamsii]
MSKHISVLLTLIIIGTIFSTFGSADTDKVYYSGQAYDPEIIPSGMIPYDDNGWTQGSLFTTPIWLLKQIDPNIMSTVLDQGVIQDPMIIPEGYQRPTFMFQNPTKLIYVSPFNSKNPSGPFLSPEPTSDATSKYSPFSTA